MCENETAAFLTQRNLLVGEIKMSFRNLSPQAMFEKMALEHTPKFKFGVNENTDFTAWKNDTLPAVLQTLGDFPERVPPNPELMAEWQDGEVVKQRWLIDVGPHISAICLVAFSKRQSSKQKRPAIMCWHGHGPYGKEPVMGNGCSPEVTAVIKQYNYDYGMQMALKGFVTYAIDWIGCGERNDNRKPNFRNTNASRDWCNLYYLHATMLGMTSISINVMHGMVATDFVCGLPQVDPQRLGVMGLSGGGTMTLWSSLCDERFKAMEIICYSNLWPYFGFRDINYCGMQVAPGLFKLVDLPDAQGLLAPRPLLIDIGSCDSCFVVDMSMKCYNQLQKIYTAAGAEKKLELDLFHGEHAWGGNKSEAFFRKYL